MSRIPASLLVHEVTVRPLEGESSTGMLWGDPFILKCMAQGGRRMVRSQSGTEVLSTLTLYAAPEDAARVPPGSQVTWQGDTTDVLATILHDAGNLPTPNHTEVVCQ